MLFQPKAVAKCPLLLRFVAVICATIAGEWLISAGFLAARPENPVHFYGEKRKTIKRSSLWIVNPILTKILTNRI
jgi:hypothetical protein